MPVDDTVPQLDSDADDEKSNDDYVIDVDDANANTIWAAQAGIAEAAAAAVTGLQQFQTQMQIAIEQLPTFGANPFDSPPNPGRSLEENLRQAIREEVAKISSKKVALDSLYYRYFAAACGILTSVVASHTLYALLKGGGSSAKAVTFSESESNPYSGPDAQSVTNAWVMKDEPTFWSFFSNYVKTNAPRSYPEQLLFMQFTQDIAHRREPSAIVQWTSAEEKLAFIKTISDKISSDGLAAAYELLPTLQHGGQPLPRAVAANIMAMALASVFQTVSQ